jgi:hypothetical protein
MVTKSRGKTTLEARSIFETELNLGVLFFFLWRRR